MKKVLLAEDDADFAGILKQYLELYGFTVSWCKDGAEALALLRTETFNICILDVMMPKTDGFKLAEQLIRINPELPFVFLTARQQKEDKINGLRLGADDYIAKPFEADELVLRLNNILKRTERSLPMAAAAMPIGRYTFDASRFELILGDRIQRLTEKETALILFLYQHKNQLLKRETVLGAVWHSDDFFAGRSMDVFISRLRRYFSDDNSISIESIRNLGLEMKVVAPRMHEL